MNQNQTEYPTRIDLCDGKYSVIFDMNSGLAECLHNGAQWRNLFGDKMVLAMFDRIVELEEELKVCSELKREYQERVELGASSAQPTDNQIKQCINDHFLSSGAATSGEMVLRFARAVLALRSA